MAIAHHLRWHTRIAALALLAAAPWPAHARGYSPQGQCGGYERVAITSPKGTCVALVADERDGLRAPRRVLEVAPGRLWIIDMGSWVPRQGRLLELTLPTNPSPSTARPQVTVLLDKLDRPLALQRAPDDRIYIAETDRIWRMALPPPGRAPERELVLGQLPNDGAHPLKELAFGVDGSSLFVNMGAVTDRCQDAQGALPLPCPERNAFQFRGAVWRAVLHPQPSPGQPVVQQFAPYALGLRNSVALATLPDGPAAGSLWQGENNIDYRDKNEPPEELNELREGADYGWPYCVGAQRPARGYEKRFDCRSTQASRLLWPAHAAPLHLLATPANSAFQGQLLAA